MPDVRPAQPLALDPDPALHELLEAIRRGGREAYRRLLELLRELQDARARQRRCYKQALAELARVQGVVLGNVGVYRRRLRRPRDAHRTPRPRSPRRSSARASWPRRCAAAATGCRCCAAITAQTLAGVAGEEQVLVFAERVRCLRQLAAHAARAPRRRGARRRRLASPAREFEALKRRFTAGEFPVLCLSRDRARGPQPPERLGARATSTCRGCPTGLEQRVGRAARPGAARGCGADLHPLHPRRRDRARRLRARPARRRAPPDPRLLRRRRAPPSRRSPPSSARSPARSPTARTTPATPAPPPGCASPPACSAAEPPTTTIGGSLHARISLTFVYTEAYVACIRR